MSPYNPWKDSPYLPLVGNARNASGITAEELQTAVVRALQRWEHASGRAFSFDYWQGTDLAQYPSGMKRDGVSSIFFASTDDDPQSLSPTQSAYTRVYFDAQSGYIDEVDIVLNDEVMSFTTNPDEATYRGGSENGHVIVLEDVITHELGHALGLGHSGIQDSTMFAYGWDDQANLSCDDIHAVQALYDTSFRKGALTGIVRAPDGSPVHGAHVVAIDLAGPHIAGSALTNAEGEYTLEALEPSDYALLVEPFFAGNGALDDVYADVDPARACDGIPYSRTFAGTPDEISIFHVQAGRSSVVEETVVSCDGVAPGQLLQDGPSAPLTFRFNERGAGAALLLPGGGVAHDLEVELPEGPVELSFISSALFSPARVRAELWGSNFDDNATSQLAPHADEDARIEASWISAGRHVVHIETDRLHSGDFPMGSTYAESSPFLLVVARQGGTYIGDACVTKTPTPDYVSPAGAPRRRYNVRADDASSGCSLTPGRSHSSDPFSSASAWLLASFVGWLAGFRRLTGKGASR